MRKDDEKYLEKAAVLVEALPYIQKFNRKVIVVKYGGSAMVDEELTTKILQDVTLLKYVGVNPILVHGGGPEITETLGKMGKQSTFVDGVRVTDEEAVGVALMVLAGILLNPVQLDNFISFRGLILVILVISGMLWDLWFISSQVSILKRRNQELAMQISLLNQDCEKILKELEELRKEQ